MLFTTLVSTDALAEHVGDWRIFDCRHDLANPDSAERQYREAHILGAVFAHLDRDLSGPRGGRSGRHPLPEPDAFGAWLGRQGVHPHDQVVCYDAGNGTVAARLWWMLRWIGHDAVALLDGGLAKWVAEGRPVSSDVPRFERTSHPARPRNDRAVGGDLVEKELDRLVLIDARAPARFRGEHEPIDRVAGHIPGASNRFCNDNVGPDGTFKSAEALKSEFDGLLGERDPCEVVSYCGSGVSACHNLLAMEIAGMNGARLYAGSWSEWITDPKRPVAD